MKLVKQLGSESILIRLGASMGMIVILALVSILISAVFTEMSSGKAEMINLAGSLRMHAYTIATQVVDSETSGARKAAAVERALAEFERTLDSPTLLAALPPDPNHPLRKEFQEIRGEWAAAVKPLAREAASNAPRRADFLSRVGTLVGHIDRLVQSVEQAVERRFSLLRLVQGISLALILSIIGITVFLMHWQVLRPITDLLRCARAVRIGDFAVRARHVKEDELGQLGQAFNFMVRDLSQMYAHLEARVEEKTKELARSNQSLELLYGTIRDLSERPITREALTHVLREVEQVVGVPAGALRACGGAQGAGLQLAASVLASDDSPRVDLRYDARSDTSANGRLVAIPLCDSGRTFGMMQLQLPRERELAPWQTQLLEAVGRHIGAALAMAERNDECHRLALFEERSVIARELHDSLAQSLSYLKIQVTRLQLLLSKDAPAEQISAVVAELKSGLVNAYRQLRELLTTFRLRIDGRGLNAALEDTVREFAHRARFTIALDNRLLGMELTGNEEIHVLQVIREALTNVDHHAHAKQVSVTLERLADDRVRVRIEDDGIGIGHADPPRNHYGLVIMQDRAQSLGGELHVDRRESKGTRVELEFKPQTAPPLISSLAQEPAA